MRKKRRRFTAEFKAEAVRLIASGRRVTEVARELDVNRGQLSRWAAKAEQAGQPGVLTPEDESELVRLRREVEQLRMEREILKKATAFFAKESK